MGALPAYTKTIFLLALCGISLVFFLKTRVSEGRDAEVDRKKAD